MGRDHDHHHDDDEPRDHGAAFAIGIAMNLAFVVVESFYGVRSQSLALLADAAHNLGDVLGLGLAWGATVMARARPTRHRTFGLRRATIVASSLNALILLLVTGGLAREAIGRLLSGETPESHAMIFVALGGVVVNGASALLFLRGHKRDLNVRSALVHLASDALLALGVAVAGGVIAFTGWTWLDPIVSLVLSVVILLGTWSLLRRSTHLILDGVPEHVDPAAVLEYLRSLPGVVEVHDLHIWALSTTETALTVHLVLPTQELRAHMLGDIAETLRRRFGIGHATTQLEPPEAEPCVLTAHAIVHSS